MTKFFIVFACFLALWSCNSTTTDTPSGAEARADSLAAKAEASVRDSVVISPSTNNLIDSLRFGMKEEEIIALLGEPTRKETVGKDAKTPAEDWYYGDNQKVRVINHTVNRVVKDVAREQELLKQLLEAKRNKNEAEVQRIMQELTKGHK